MDSGIESIIGKKFIRGKQEVKMDEITPKLWGLYFAAQWCPPCMN
jgi:hypothetical protein